VKAFAFVLAVLLSTSTAHAGCPSAIGGNATLEDIDPKERLLFIQKRIDHDARNVRIWFWTWFTIYSGLSVGNAIRFHWARTRGNYVDTTTGTGGSVFGLLVLSIMPPAVLRDQHVLARVVGRYQDGDCETLAEAEKILLRDAKSEAFGKGPLVHAGNFVFNSALGILLIAAFNRWQLASIVAPVGITAGELQQLTTLTNINGTLARYKAGDLRDASVAQPVSWGLQPMLSPGQFGASFGMKF
jgi:hypothetical protein